MTQRINEDLLNLKINITCTNDIAYMDCAYLLDKPDFLKLVPGLRKRFGITQLIPYENFNKWRSQKLIESVTSMTTKIKDPALLNKFKEIMKKDPLDIEASLQFIPFYKQFEWITQNLSRQFKRPEYFTTIIQYALVCGEVGNDSYQTTSIEVYPPEPYVDEIPYPEIVIRISPMTTKNDLIKVFEENVPKIFKDNEKLLSHYYNMKKDPAPNIRTVREWYWRNLAGESYTDIALSITSAIDRKHYEYNKMRDAIPGLDQVRQALRRYKKLLAVYM